MSKITIRRSKAGALETLRELADNHRASAKRLGNSKRSPKAAYESGQAFAFETAIHILEDVVVEDDD